MAAIFSFKCSNCGNIHEGSPSFGFRAPDPYLQQSREVQEKGFLGTDLCQYEDEDGMHYFIRVCLEVPIHGVTEPFMWGVWVSLSEDNFNRYVETYDSPETEDCYFGWFCNFLPYYENTYALKTHVHPRAGGDRPYIELEDTSHPLSVDFHQGISIIIFISSIVWSGDISKDSLDRIMALSGLNKQVAEFPGMVWAGVGQARQQGSAIPDADFSEMQRAIEGAFKPSEILSTISVEVKNSISESGAKELLAL